jgi:thiamine kinase-like enzyme
MDDSFMHSWNKGRKFGDHRTIIRETQGSETARVYVRYNHKKKDHPFTQKTSNEFTAAVNYLLRKTEETQCPLAYVDLSFSPINSRLQLTERTEEFRGIFTQLDDLWDYPSSIRELWLVGCPIENLPLKQSVKKYFAGEKVKEVVSETLEELYAEGLGIERLECPRLKKLHVSKIAPDSLPPLLEELHTHSKEQEPLDLRGLPALKRVYLFQVTNLRGWQLPETGNPQIHIPATTVHEFRDKLPKRMREYLDQMDNARGGDFLRNILRAQSDATSDIPMPVYYFDEAPKQYASLESQLVKLFPNAPDVLDSILPKLDISLSELEKVTDRTYSGVVFSFLVRNEKDQYVKVYAKAGTRDVIVREQRKLRDTWTYPLLRPITPKCAGVLETEKGAVLLTYEAGNSNIVTSHELEQYRRLRNDAITMYAQQESINPNNAKKNRLLIDAFNRALFHREMQSHEEETEYSPSRMLNVPFGSLEERAAKTTATELFEKFMRIRTGYENARQTITDDEPEKIAIIHGDAWDENIKYSPDRQLVDFACVQTDRVEWDLATSSEPMKMIKPYLFFTQYLGDQKRYNPQKMREQVSAAGIILATRYLSSKLERNCLPEARYSTNLLNMRLQL